MSSISIVINILAGVGLLVIIAYIIYYLYNYIENYKFQQSVTQLNPPPTYMQNSGLNCPDYWVNTGIDSNGNSICQNSFNVSSQNCPSTMYFAPIPSANTWIPGNPGNQTTFTDEQQYNFLSTTVATGGSTNNQNALSRCAWINQCGPNQTTQGVWQGVNELCNSPPTS